MKLFWTILAALVAFMVLAPLLGFLLKITFGLVQLAILALVIVFIIGVVRRMLRV